MVAVATRARASLDVEAVRLMFSNGLRLICQGWMMDGWGQISLG